MRAHIGILGSSDAIAPYTSAFEHTRTSVALVRVGDDERSLVDDPDVDGLLILSPLTERNYWIKETLGAGKGAIALSPPAPSASEAKNLLKSAEDRGLPFSVVCEPLNLPESLFPRGGEWGTLRYLRIDFQVPRQWLGRRDAGVLSTHALWIHTLLEKLAGSRIDWLIARTRSLAVARPTEDLATVQLAFENGAEGMLEVNGLGGEARLRILAQGDAGEFICEEDLRPAYAEGLCFQMDSFAAALTGTLRTTSLRPDLSQISRGMRFVDWVRHSARLEKGLYWHEMEL
ncbi:MAG: hypothetical protein VX733_05970 [Candidatus Latescibacterota bacterium]|nr:hypothetical protein [Candidatus Latescibacterota bacterium]